MHALWPRGQQIRSTIECGFFTDPASKTAQPLRYALRFASAKPAILKGPAMPDQEVVFAPEVVTARLEKELPTWIYRDGWIRREYKTGGWPFTLMTVNAIGYLAEAAFHHPDLNVTWGQVTVKLATHSAKGITEKDFELARKIEAAVIWQPGEGDALAGFEKGFKKKWTR